MHAVGAVMYIAKAGVAVGALWTNPFGAAVGAFVLVNEFVSVLCVLPK